MGSPASPTTNGCPFTWRRYLGSVGLVAVATTIGALALRHVSPTNVVMLYLLAVVVSGLLWGQGAAVLSSITGVITFDYFIVPPRFNLTVDDAEYLITFAGLLSVALVIGTLTGRLRDHALALKAREREASALVSFVHAMVAAQGVSAVAEVAAQHVSESLGRPAAIVWLERDSEPQMFNVDCLLSAEELASVGRILMEGRDFSGDGSPLPLSDWETARFSTEQSLVGVLAVRRSGEVESLAPGQRHLLGAFAAQVATMVERAQLSEAAQRAKVLEEAERLHDVLLHSVSHALRTPMSSIIGSLSALAEQGDQPLSQSTRADLIDTAKEEAERLNSIVGNLLDMTRLQSGHLKLNRDWYDLEDVIGAALAQTNRDVQQHPVRVQLPEEPLLARLDQVLIVQVLDNLLQNASKYSPIDTPIEINVTRSGESVEVRVVDCGPGIPPHDLERVFEKFYRLAKPEGGPAGSGLGLAICKGIVEAHGGQIWAQASAGGGTEVVFTLPIDAV